MPPDVTSLHDGQRVHFDDHAPLDLGARVRELRAERGWSLNEASDRVALSRSTLHKIEKDKTSPTLDALTKLAQGFGMGVSELLGDRRPQAATGRRCVTRHNERETHTTANYVYLPLAHELAYKAMLPFRLIVKARSLDDFEEWDRHDSEDFVHVLSGSMMLYTETYAPLELNEGDSIYYDGRTGHACISTSENDAVVLWVSSHR